MGFIVYSKGHPEGVKKDGSLFTADIVGALEKDGVYRGKCPCCDKRLVVRFAGERTAMTAGDEHFLLHEGGRDGN